MTADDKRERFVQMMKEAQAELKPKHPEVDEVPSNQPPKEAVEEFKERTGLNDEDFTFVSFDTSDPEQLSALKTFLKDYYVQYAGTVDPGDNPLDDPEYESAVADMFASMSGTSDAVPVDAGFPLPGEAFLDFVVRLGFGDFFKEELEAQEVTLPGGTYSDIDDDISISRDEVQEIIDWFEAIGVTLTPEDVEDMMGEEPFPAVDDGEVNVRSDVLRTAESLVNGARNREYGDPNSDFSRTASMWTTYLSGVADRNDGEVYLLPHDVAAMMILLKISRISWSPNKKDHWVDAAGYSAAGADCAYNTFGGLV